MSMSDLVDPQDPGDPEVVEAEPLANPKEIDTASMSTDLLNQVTNVLLSLPAGQVFDLLTRLRDEVRFS